MTEVTKLKSVEKEIKMSGHVRAMLMNVLDGMPVKKMNHAKTAMRLYRFLEGEDWLDWEEWQKVQQVPPEKLNDTYKFTARKKDIKALTSVIEEAIENGILHGRGLRLASDVYEQINDKPLDDEE